ncbi:MAG: Hsp20/alpha crystallin family protein [Chloroflexia bacterium]
MATKDIVKTSGNNTNLPAKREHEALRTALPAFGDIDNWTKNWNQWFDNFFARWAGFAPTRFTGLPWSSAGNTFVPAVNISTGDNEIRVTAELPGMDDKDVEVFIDHGALAIKGHKEQETEDNKGDYYRMERSYGAFQRTIPLPQEVDQEHITATFNKGVLTVTLPTLHQLQPGAKKIEIQSAS